MIAGTPVLDLDDVASLEAADTGGVLRSAASGGAQVRAAAADIAEGALARLDGLRPRSLVLVAGTGRAARAATLLQAAFGDRAGLPIVAATTIPQWVGSLDVVIVAGDDSADPRLSGAVDRALRRGAEVVVAAPDEGPMRAAAAGHAAIVAPRVRVLDHNRILRFLAVGVAVLQAIDPAHIRPLVPDLEMLADVLDAEALRDGPHNEVFHNPAKTLAARMRERRLVLTGDSPAAAVVAQHGAEVLLQTAGLCAAAADLTEAVAANARLTESAEVTAPGYDPLFHDEQLDGPAPVDRARVFVVSADPDEVAARRRLAVFGAGAGIVDAELVNVDVELMRTEASVPRNTDTGEPRSPVAGRGSELEQLAVLVLRLEMAAAYLRLLTGPTAASRPAHYDGGHY